MDVKRLTELPEEAKVTVYYLDPDTKELKFWEGVYEDCPYPTATSDWYILDTVEASSFLIVAYNQLA